MYIVLYHNEENISSYFCSFELTVPPATISAHMGMEPSLQVNLSLMKSFICHKIAKF